MKFVDDDDELTRLTQYTDYRLGLYIIIYHVVDILFMYC